MPTALSLLEQHQEQQQQLHLDRVHSAYQALAAVADRLNTFDDLPSSPALHPIIPQIQLNYSKVINSYERKIKTFLDTPVPPDVCPQIHDQIISRLTHIANILEMHHLEAL
jgi:hypothetical protein